MGFTEDEFYRTPMGKDPDDWVKKYYRDNKEFINQKIGINNPPQDSFIPTELKIHHSRIDYNFEESVQKVFETAKRILLQKHKDYGPKNISQSPGGPLNGLRVRLWDKMARINNLIDSNAEPENESLRDSFLDMANYALIAILVLDGDWDKDN